MAKASPSQRGPDEFRLAIDAIPTPLALVALYKSLGGGWKTASADASTNVTADRNR
jgi:hypothetical protein